MQDWLSEILPWLLASLAVWIAAWLLLAIAVGVWAYLRGRRAWLFFSLALVISPPLAAVAVYWLPVNESTLQARRLARSGEVNRYRCRASDEAIECTYNVTKVRASLLGNRRKVQWQLPSGNPPSAGWPAALFFHGTGFPGHYNFAAEKDDPYGGYYQAQTTAKLLDAGYAVIVPNGFAEVGWLTNVPPYSLNWDLPGNPDRYMLERLFEQMEAGDYGPLDLEHLYALGISSGGYMTSRMAVSYPGRFRALAIVSAAYATCFGPLCRIPKLPEDHPPTLFLHGLRDATVPAWTAKQYQRKLKKQGVETRMVTSARTGHAWIAQAPDEILGWFESHR